jgi:hypothetical protein
LHVQRKIKKKQEREYQKISIFHNLGTAAGTALALAGFDFPIWLIF